MIQTPSIPTAIRKVPNFVIAAVILLAVSFGLKVTASRATPLGKQETKAVLKTKTKQREAAIEAGISRPVIQPDASSAFTTGFEKSGMTEAALSNHLCLPVSELHQTPGVSGKLEKADMTEAALHSELSSPEESQTYDSESLASDDGMVRILVKAKVHMSEAALHAQLSLHGASQQIDPISPELDVRVIKVPLEDVENVLQVLQANEDLEYAEPDLVAHTLAKANDPYFTSGQQWCLNKINAKGAWENVKGSSNVIVAVLDTGVLESHPDINKRKVLRGYNFVDNNRDTTDDNGHGTAVAGLISASTNNGSGMASLTKGNPILPVKVLNAEGSGTYSNIAKGIVWATKNGARIINLSLGGTTKSQTLQKAVNYAWRRNVIVIAAAGNNGNKKAFYPAACRNVVAVSATNSADKHPEWSSYGRYVDVAAPGESVLSLYGPKGYAYWSGTSFSSPITAGVAALMVSANESLSNKTIVDALRRRSDDIGPKGSDIYFGRGRINARRAVAAVASDHSSDTSAPVARIKSSSDGARISGKMTDGSCLSGSVVINVFARDNVATTRVELYIGGVLYKKSDSASAAFVWDTTNSRDGGPYVLEARAYDEANNVGVNRIKVKVRNSKIKDEAAPRLAVKSHKKGSLLKGKTTKIRLKILDNVAVKKVELYLDGKLVGIKRDLKGKSKKAKSRMVTFGLKKNRISRGAHVLQAYGFDAAGNIGSSHRVLVYK